MSLKKVCNYIIYNSIELTSMIFYSFLLLIVSYNTYNVIINFFNCNIKYVFKIVISFHRVCVLNIYIKIHRNISISFGIKKFNNQQTNKRWIRGSPLIRGDPRMQ